MFARRRRTAHSSEDLCGILTIGAVISGERPVPSSSVAAWVVADAAGAVFRQETEAANVRCYSST